LRLNRWHHLAVVFDANGTTVYLDGLSAGTTSYKAGLAGVSGAARHFIGSCSLYPNNSFRGEFDEVRLWRGARTAEQIRQNKDRALSGSETGLVGLWNFDDAANPGRDASPNGYHGTLIRAAPVALAQAAAARPAFRAQTSPPLPFAAMQ